MPQDRLLTRAFLIGAPTVVECFLAVTYAL